MAKTTKRTNGKVPEGFELNDLSHFTMKDYRRFQHAVTEANREDIYSYFEICTEVIKAWPFDYAGDPSEPDSYDNLKPSDWSAIDDLVGATISNIFHR